MSDGIVFIDDNFVAPADAKMSIFDVGFVWGDTAYDAVSYTHLTLPTNREV